MTESEGIETPVEFLSPVVEVRLPNNYSTRSYVSDLNSIVYET